MTKHLECIPRGWLTCLWLPGVLQRTRLTFLWIENKTKTFYFVTIFCYQVSKCSHTTQNLEKHKQIGGFHRAMLCVPARTILRTPTVALELQLPLPVPPADPRAGMDHVLLWVNHCAEHFACIYSLNPPNHQERM